jgi:hypothetical protein
MSPGLDRNRSSSGTESSQSLRSGSLMPNKGTLINSSIARIVPSQVRTASASRYCDRTATIPALCEVSCSSISNLASFPEILRDTSRRAATAVARSSFNLGRLRSQYGVYRACDSPCTYSLPFKVFLKRTTVAQMWTRLEEVWRSNRKLGPGWSRGWKAAHEAQKTVGIIYFRGRSSISTCIVF